MAKSADAFRTISEVAEWLEVPAHVLRFWESKFSQVKPVKRAGGRRYYRPSDMRLLGGIKALLHDEGMTIKGVQKLLREEGVQHVASLSQYLDDGSADQTFDMASPDPAAPAQVLAFERPGTPPEDESDAAEDMTGDEDSPPPTASTDTEESAGAPPFETTRTMPASESDPEPEAVKEPEAEPESEAETAAPVKTGPEPDLASNPDDDPRPEPPPEPEDTPPDNIFADDIADRPQAHSEQEYTETQTAPSESDAPSLPPLPDLPADPADDLPGAPGALNALAALKRPVSRDLAAELTGLSSRLRACGVKKDANDVPGT
ncbi:DNA-binding transcriptional MerR regulator [Roseovarius sp. MBR-154]|jgi:DNA-binding transcriptional MerR regulator